jgi:hypothetical protein
MNVGKTLFAKIMEVLCRGKPSHASSSDTRAMRVCTRRLYRLVAHHGVLPARG